MAKGALYWRLKDEKTGKWTYQRVSTMDEYKLYKEIKTILSQGEE